MSDNQKLPPPSPANKFINIIIGDLQIPLNPQKNIEDSGVASQSAISKIEEAIKKGTFEGFIKEDEKPSD